jgi:hypothetical protein
MLYKGYHSIPAKQTFLLKYQFRVINYEAGNYHSFGGLITEGPAYTFDKF